MGRPGEGTYLLGVIERSLPLFVISSCRLLSTHYFPLLSSFCGITVILSPLSDCISHEYQGDTGFVLIDDPEAVRQETGVPMQLGG
jgi:hypothetical protein